MYWHPIYSDWWRLIPFWGGWLADRLLGDPTKGFHPIVWFGRIIAAGEKQFNRGEDRLTKGACMAIGCIVGTFVVISHLLQMCAQVSPWLSQLLTGAGVFYCLAGKTLIQEVKAVFEAVDRSTEEGRKQVARIVGRDTSELDPQEIRTAALETLAENLSDGVIAPMFWFALTGLPGMMAYKMANTLDSMIGYKNERYKDFGRIAAQIDDFANFIPARLTAYLMLIAARKWDKRSFVHHYGSAHASPNSGYPEAALAAILDCQFGGTHNYFGQPVVKPLIGDHPRPFTTEDMQTAIQVNSNAEVLMGILVTLYFML